MIYSNAMGYGFWCNEDCAKRKAAAGIPPLGTNRKEDKESQSDLLLSQAALEQARKQDSGLSPMAITGIVVVSLAAVGGLIWFIRKR